MMLIIVIDKHYIHTVHTLHKECL